MRRGLLAAALALQGCVTVHVARSDDSSRSETLELPPGRARIVSREFDVRVSTDPSRLTLSCRDTISGPEAKVVTLDSYDCEDLWSPIYIAAAPLVLAVTPFAMLADWIELPENRFFIVRTRGNLAPPLDRLGLYLLVGLNPQPCYRYGNPAVIRREKLTGRTASAAAAGAGERLTYTLTADRDPALSISGRATTDAAGLAAIDWSALRARLSAPPKSLTLDVGLADDGPRSRLELAADDLSPHK